MKIILGNSLEKLKELEDNSIDSIVTDPPYELGFMGKKWDNTGIANNVDLWAECLRVLKPGGHLLAFSGTRTYHRMASAIEDAGFEVRDMIEWVYGSGFPKSLNIGKAVDKLGGRCLGQEIGNIIKQKRIELGYSTIKLAEIGGFYGNTNHGGTVSNWETGNGSITPEQFNKLIDILGLENEPVIANKRKLLGKQTALNGFIFDGLDGKTIGKKEIDITKGTSEWEGWGTALKPAHEPICMARKPLAEKNVAQNVLKWGTGGINIDESRVGMSQEDKEMLDAKASTNNNGVNFDVGESKAKGTATPANNLGRFPANLIHDNSDEVRECFPETKNGGQNNTSKRETWLRQETEPTKFSGDSGSASRFFKSIIYNPKASKAERNKGCEGLEEKQYSHDGREKEIENAFQRNKSVSTNSHPTVKPIALMEYLIKMVTPKGGTVLDPFMGSGSTGVAAKKNGYDFIGIDMTPEYIEIAKARINATEIENRLI